MTAATAPPTTRRWWVLAVLCLSVLLVSVDNTIVNVALPTISRDLSATTSQLQWVVDAYTLAFAGAAAARRRTWATGSAGAGCCRSAWSRSP